MDCLLIEIFRFTLEYTSSGRWRQNSVLLEIRRRRVHSPGGRLTDRLGEQGAIPSPQATIPVTPTRLTEGRGVHVLYGLEFKVLPTTNPILRASSLFHLPTPPKAKLVCNGSTITQQHACISYTFWLHFFIATKHSKRTVSGGKTRLSRNNRSSVDVDALSADETAVLACEEDVCGA